MTEYAFIDGGYLRKGWNDLVRQWHMVEVPLDYSKLFGQYIGADKYFIYDAIETAKKPNESENEFIKRKSEKERQIAVLEEIPNCHVELGELVLGSTGYRQKGVDVKLAVDALEHAHKKNCDAISIFAGDRYFIPLVRALIHNGIDVKLWYFNGSISKELIRSADTSRVISLTDSWNVIVSDFPGSRQAIDVRRGPAYAEVKSHQHKLYKTFKLKCGEFGYWGLDQQRVSTLLGRDEINNYNISITAGPDQIVDFVRIEYGEEITLPELPERI